MDIQLAKLQEKSNVLLWKIQAWLIIQQLYMVSVSILCDQLSILSHSTDKPEFIELLLLSAVGKNAVFDESLCCYEWEHHNGQANDALNEIQDHLHLQTHCYKFKNHFIWGQRPNTWFHSNINQLAQKIDLLAKKYETAHQALVNLMPILNKIGWNTYLKPLDREKDIRALNEAGYDQSEGNCRLS